ncbi:MAG TPA: TRAP transporter small permease [Paenalcaligenes sp.]|nr:TRAP transporter small permease [Paenalcaligenes sp.]
MTSMPITNRSATAVFYRIVWHPLDFVVSKIESLLLLICSLAIIAAMLLTTTDVAMRYLFKSPISWAFDFVMLYLMPAAYYLAFSYGMKSGTHLAVDFFINYMPNFVLRYICPPILLLGSALMFYISWRLLLETWERLVEGHTMFGPVAWLTWPTAAIIGISFFIFALRIVLVVFQPSGQGA